MKTLLFISFIFSGFAYAAQSTCEDWLMLSQNYQENNRRYKEILKKYRSISDNYQKISTELLGHSKEYKSNIGRYETFYKDYESRARKYKELAYSDPACKKVNYKIIKEDYSRFDTEFRDSVKNLQMFSKDYRSILVVEYNEEYAKILSDIKNILHESQVANNTNKKIDHIFDKKYYDQQSKISDQEAIKRAEESKEAEERFKKLEEESRQRKEREKVEARARAKREAESKARLERMREERERREKNPNVFDSIVNIDSYVKEKFDIKPSVKPKYLKKQKQK